MSGLIDIKSIMKKLGTKRCLFTSEADFQLELAWIIKDEYPNAKVRLEYCPSFNLDMHIDILVIIENNWIPIELKYKTKGCCKTVDCEVINLKNHSAKDVNCYLYLKDVQRIELIRDNVPSFYEGYTIFLTNELSYTKNPSKKGCVYEQFSLGDGNVKTGILDWGINASAGTKKNCEDPIVLNGCYPIKWNIYSTIDASNTGTFMYLVNQIT